MQTRTLKIKGVQVLNDIQKALSEHLPLSEIQQNELDSFLSQLPSANMLFSEKIPISESVEINVWDTKSIEDTLNKWIILFDNIPGYDYCPCCLLVYGEEKLLRKNVIMTASFAPTMAYNLGDWDGYEVHLRDDGTASFYLPTLADAEKYPELYSFRGSWKEAYLLLIETLKKGWPMEEFPEELQKFLPSKK